MRSTFKILFYINRSKIKSDGTTPILCRITVDNKQAVLTTGSYCEPSGWNSKKGKVEDGATNHKLVKLRERIEQTYEDILKEQGVISAELLKNIVLGVNSVPTSLLQAGEVERERLRKRSLEINSTSTYRQSKTTQSNLRDFVLSRGMEDIVFSDITEEFGESFKSFLKKDLGYATTHVNHCLCWLNRLVYIAVDQEVLRSSPIEDVEYEKKLPPKLRHITRNELKKIMETPMPYERQELARRAFIFSAFTGLAFHRTIQEEFYAVAFRKKIYRSIEEIQTDLDNWMWYYNNERTHSGKYCYGKTPMQTFFETKNIAKEKLLENLMQQQNILTFGSQETIDMNHKMEI